MVVKRMHLRDRGQFASNDNHEIGDQQTWGPITIRVVGKELAPSPYSDSPDTGTSPFSYVLDDSADCVIPEDDMGPWRFIYTYEIIAYQQG